MEQTIQNVIDFVKNNEEKWLESPRKIFVGGRSERAQEFKVSLKPKTEKFLLNLKAVPDLELST